VTINQLSILKNIANRPQGRSGGFYQLIACFILTVTLLILPCWAYDDQDLPLETANVRINSDFAQTFLCPDGRNCVILQGNIKINSGRRLINSDNAVIWIGQLPEPASTLQTYRLNIFLQGNPRSLPKNEPTISPEDQPQVLLLDFSTTGKIYLTAETRIQKPGFDQEIYQLASTLTSKFLKPQSYRPLSPTPQPPDVEPPTPAQQKPAPLKKPQPEKTKPAPDSPAPKTTPQKTVPDTKQKLPQPTRPQEKLPTQPPQKTKADSSSRPFQDVAQYPVHIPQLGGTRLISHPQPDGTDIITYTGGFYAYQYRPDQQETLELRAQNAVVFYSQGKIQQLAAARQDPNQADAQILGQVVSGVYLEDDVVFEAGTNRITADKFYYDFARDQALVLDGTLRFVLPETQQPMYVRAEKIRRLNENRFVAENVQVSNDEFSLPHVWLGARSADVLQTDQPGIADQTASKKSYQLDLRDVTGNVSNLPIFYWPRITAAGQATTKAPVKALHASYNSDFGVSAESEWDMLSLMGLIQPPGLDATLKLDEFSKRGTAGGIDLDYTQQNYFGNLRTYLIGDRGQDDLGRFDSRDNIEPPHDTRGRARWQHRQFLPYDWQATFELGYLSDPFFLESWEEKEFDTDKPQETLVYFKQQRDNWAFDFLAKWQLNDFEYTQTQLPRAGFHLAGQDLFELFTYQHDSYVTRINERAGDRDVPGLNGSLEPWNLPGMLDQEDFAFAQSRHELYLPLHIGGIHRSPTVIGTYVYDDANPADNSFVQGAAGIRAATQLWHIDKNVRSELFDLDQIRHIVIPQVSAFWIDSDLTEERHPNVYNFAILQRWQTKRGPAGNKRSVDFLRFDSSVTLVRPDIEQGDLPNKFFFATPEPQFDKMPLIYPDFSNLGLSRREQINQTLRDSVRGDWTWLISDTTAVIGDINYDMHKGNISQAGSALAVQRTPRTSYYIGNLFLNDADTFGDGNPPRVRNSHFLTAGISYKLNRKYTLGFAHQYDIVRTTDTFNQAVIIRKFSHWYGALVLSHDSARNNLGLSFSVWPENYDKITIGSRRFTRLAR